MAGVSSEEDHLQDLILVLLVLWVVGTKLRTSGPAASVFDTKTSQQPKTLIFKKCLSRICQSAKL